MRSATDGWIVGNYATILHWNGTYWRRLPAPNHVGAIYDVSILSATDAWAAAGTGYGGVVLRWNGSSWQPIGLPNPSPTPLTITMLSPTYGWLGDRGGAHLWNGVSWARDARVFSESYTSTALSPTDVWMAGRGLYRYNGTTWTSYDPKGVIAEDIMFASPQDGWIAGSVITFCYQDHCTYDAATAHWDGASWALVGVPNPGPTVLRGVSTSGTSGTWAAGQINTAGLILRWSGSSWVEVPIPAGVGPLTGIAMVSATDGWAIGLNGEILRWNGGAWSLWNVELRQIYLPLS